MRKIPNHIIRTTDLDSANRLCEDWYYLVDAFYINEEIVYVLARLRKKRDW